MEEMEKNYWLGRWERGETGWHQSEIEPALVQWMDGKPPSRVFVPLCGKTKDMKWLLDQGHTVVGCELSLQACEAFFSENKIDFTTEPHSGFTLFKGERIRIFGGDFFSLSSSEVGAIDRLYDRAALIALPNETRVRYVRHLLALIAESTKNPDFEFLQIILERTPSDTQGPPFSISPEEIRTHYGSRFEIGEISREKVDATSPVGSSTVEHVFRLRANAKPD